MNKEEIKKIKASYSANIEKYFNSYASEVDRNEFDKKFLNDFSYLINQGEKILDIGCGSTCQSARYLSKKFSITGIDIVPECIEYAKSKFPNLDLALMDFTDLKYGDESFAAVIGYYCLGHIPSDERMKALLELKRVIRKDGYLALVVHEGDHDGPNDRFGTFFKSFTTSELKDVYRKNKAHFKKNLKPLAPSKRGTGGMSKQLIVQKMFF